MAGFWDNDDERASCYTRDDAWREAILEAQYQAHIEAEDQRRLQEQEEPWGKRDRAE